MKKTKKILIIEDEKILREMYEERFKQAGFKVISAEDGIEALKVIKEKKPDLILLDILLPKENGIDFLKKYRKTAEFSSIPVIAFSNFDDPDTKEEAKSLGVKDYLIKSNHTPKEILMKLQKYLK
ncbi:response regulator [bacterium]|nr:response regulator [bacterium]